MTRWTSVYQYGSTDLAADLAAPEQNRAVAKGKPADLQALVSKGQTWMVESEPRKL